MDLMYVVGPDLLGSGQVRTLRTLLDQIGPAAATSTVCSLLWGWYKYLTGAYDEAQQWLDTALAVAPASFDRMIATPLSINVALGRGDVAAALAMARNVTATAELADRPAELATAIGAAYTWAGLTDEARSALGIAIAKSTQQHRLTAHVLALVSLAIAEADGGNVGCRPRRRRHGDIDRRVVRLTGVPRHRTCVRGASANGSRSCRRAIGRGTGRRVGTTGHDQSRIGVRPDELRRHAPRSGRRRRCGPPGRGGRSDRSLPGPRHRRALPESARPRDIGSVLRPPNDLPRWWSS